MTESFRRILEADNSKLPISAYTIQRVGEQKAKTGRVLFACSPEHQVKVGDVLPFISYILNGVRCRTDCPVIVKREVSRVEYEEWVKACGIWEWFIEILLEQVPSQFFEVDAE